MLKMNISLLTEILKEILQNFRKLNMVKNKGKKSNNSLLRLAIFLRNGSSYIKILKQEISIIRAAKISK